MQDTTKFSITILLLAALAVCLYADETQATPALPQRGSPANVLYFESLKSVTTAAESTAPQARSHNQAISFDALGRRFDLQLEPNELFAPGARNVWVGDGGAQTETPTTVFYKGEIKGEPGSWVRVSLRNGIMDGMISSQNEIYFVEPSKRFFADPSRHDMVIYRQSDTVSDWELGSCALEHPSVEAAMESHAAAVAPSSDYDALRAELAALAGGTLERLDIALVADYEYASKHGTAAAADMQNIINQVDGIYRAEIGVTLRITTTVVFTAPSDPFSGTTDSSTLLGEFSNYKDGAASPVRNAGLAHLFTGRNLAGSTIGIAWIGTTCHPKYGTGVSEDFTSTNKLLVILTAHEMGHNFNAPHDNQGGSPCASTPFGFIMNPWLDATLDHFSACSKSQIAPLVANGSCFVTVPTGPSCSYTISSSSAALGDVSGGGTVSVTTTSGCTWTAVSNASWLTVNSGANGTGNGTVTYSVTANLSTSSRTGTITIAGQTFTVTQNGVPPCVSLLSPSSGVHGPGADIGTISISTSSSCNWTATSNASWITTISAPSGTGNGAVTYAVAENTDRASRTGTLTIGEQTFTVTQAPYVKITVLTPTGGESWPLGSPQTIRWASSGISGKVRIELSRDGGISWTDLATSTADDGTHIWKVRGAATAQARIRITSVLNPSISDMNDADFRLGGGSMTILAPVGGGLWPIGSIQKILWSSQNIYGKVRIQVSRDGGVSWTMLFSSTMNDGTQDWQVKGPATSQIQLRVIGVNDKDATATSNVIFITP